MKILYLYAELMGYQAAVLREYVRRYGAEVHVVHWDREKLTPYQPPVIPGVTYHARSGFTAKTLKSFADSLNPDIVLVSGWQDKGYLPAARRLRQRGIPVVAGFDDQWRGSLRQIAGSIIFPFFRDAFFSHAWVTGPYQYEFARKIGFGKDRILFNCYSADVDLFNAAHFAATEGKKRKYPHRFLFAGRYEPIKGVDLLVEAWRSLEGQRKDWEIQFIGNGSLKPYLERQSGIRVRDFMQPEALAAELRDYGCFILPSRGEPWAVVLHEFSAAGLPILCSDVCGAAPVFITSGLNGYVFKSESVSMIRESLLKIIRASDEELYAMSVEAHEAGQRITPRLSAASFVSVFHGDGNAAEAAH